MKSHKVLLALLVLTMMLSACGGPEAFVSTLPVKPNPPAPTSDSTLSVADLSQLSTVQPVVDIRPIPHPEPPINAVEKYALVVNAFKEYLVQHKSEIQSNEDIQKEFWKFAEYKLVYGTSEWKIKDLIQSFTDEDWSNIIQVGEELGKGGGAVVATIIYLRGCKTTCHEIFIALWYMCAHYATSPHKVFIDENGFSTHPEPILCGKSFSWERLVEILEEDCPKYRVSYLPCGVQITQMVKKSRQDSVEYFTTVNALPVVIAVTTTAVVVGVIVFAPQTAPVLVPVLLVP